MRSFTEMARLFKEQNFKNLRNFEDEFFEKVNIKTVIELKIIPVTEKIKNIYTEMLEYGNICSNAKSSTFNISQVEVLEQFRK